MTHYSANSLSVLNCLDPKKACPEVTYQLTTDTNIRSATEIWVGSSDLVKFAYQSVRLEQRATLTLVWVQATARSRVQSV